MSIVRNISLIKILEKRGPKIEPCGTPVMILWYLLKLSSIFVLCFLLVKKLSIKKGFFLSKP